MTLKKRLSLKKSVKKNSILKMSQLLSKGKLRKTKPVFVKRGHSESRATEKTSGAVGDSEWICKYSRCVIQVCYHQN